MESPVSHHVSTNWKKKIFLGLWAVISVAGVSVASFQLVKHAWPLLKGTYSRAFHSFGEKYGEIQRAHSENQKLRHENFELRAQLEGKKFDRLSHQALHHSQELGSEIQGEAGNSMARTLASIEYKPPTSLPPNQMLALAAHYFQKEDYERSVTILHRLLSRQDRNMRTPRHLLMTAVAWYHLGHLNHANHFLDELLAHESARENLPYLAQGRLWKALTAQKLKKQSDAQHWLTELLDHHPRSIEASWVNSREAKNGRKPTHHHE